MHYLKQKAAGDTITLSDVLIFEKCPASFPISTNTVLQKKMLQVYLDYYTQKGYPDTKSGMRLTELVYHDLSFRNALSFRYAGCSGPVKKDAVSETFHRNGKAKTINFYGYIRYLRSIL